MNLLGKSAVELIELLKKKTLSHRELHAYFSARIRKYNPTLNAYITIFDSLSEDSMLQKPLYGIPLAIKDNFCTKGIRTTASSKVLDGFIPPYDATVIALLKQAGATILGKTNMDAWAHGSSTETSDYGATKNPHDLTCVPGGSSGGSAASVSTYLSPLAIGSETAGSIRQPAAWCGIVGLKPTYGRVSRYGVIAMGSSLDCPGSMTLTVNDSALILEVLAGRDPYDATSADNKVDHYSLFLESKEKYTIGFADEYFDGVDSEITRKVYECIDLLKKKGHTFKKIKLIHPKYSISVYTILQRSEVSSNLSRYDGIRYGNSREFFGGEAKRRIMFGTYTLSHGYYEAYYKKALIVREMIRQDFIKVFKEVDMIIAPTTPKTALKIGEWEKYPFFGEMMDVLNEPAAIAGLPAISIPIGLDSKNLPIGMQIVGRHFDEKSILNLAHQFEKETDFFGVIKEGLKKYV
ncbi:MAG TPA: Asp-tRNA(Asn)/Glu-tRNA(Gln) amidotransferase subunit GatA [Patescibacteria group bacterium]|nr:Asp-tRNA(Asn)/Glu-tRNA(Gln) amidotransferase subunit GatA [Patescibacteria group bacterium]